jgi:hypothetical protein
MDTSLHNPAIPENQTGVGPGCAEIDWQVFSKTLISLRWLWRSAKFITCSSSEWTLLHGVEGLWSWNDSPSCSSDADGVRASQVEHAVEDLDGNGDLGLLGGLIVEAQVVADDPFGAAERRFHQSLRLSEGRTVGAKSHLTDVPLAGPNHHGLYLRRRQNVRPRGLSPDRSAQPTAVAATPRRRWFCCRSSNLGQRRPALESAELDDCRYLRSSAGSAGRPRFGGGKLRRTAGWNQQNF